MAQKDTFPLSSRSKRILLVDDEQEFVDILAERLRMRQMDVQVAYGGEEALTTLAAGSFDLVLLDLKMPGLDGLEVLRRIRLTSPDLPVVILTAHGSERDAAAARELGASAFLKKPCDFSELSEIIKKSSHSDAS